MPPFQCTAVLTIAGSDCSAGAGIQADLRAFDALKVPGTSVITCLTAQNPRRFGAVCPAPPAMVMRQVDAVCAAFKIHAVKVGMLYTAANVRAVAAVLRRYRFPHVVVDPLISATAGGRLLQYRALPVLCRELLPCATVITPNVPEAAVLAGQPIVDLLSQCRAARIIAEKYGAGCVVKGGHGCFHGAESVDVLVWQGRQWIFRQARLKVKVGRTHGTGCAFSAALTAWLARGKPLPAAVRAAQRYVARELCRQTR